MKTSNQIALLKRDGAVAGSSVIKVLVKTPSELSARKQADRKIVTINFKLKRLFLEGGEARWYRGYAKPLQIRPCRYLCKGEAVKAFPLP